MLRRWLLALAAAYVLVLIQTIAGFAASPAITMSGPVGVDRFQGHVDYLLDPEWALDVEDVRRADVAARFAPVTRRSPDFGYTKSAIWLRFSVTNANPSVEEWRVLFQENFLQLFEVYLVREDGSTETLARLDGNSDFASRPIGSATLAVAFDLRRGASATVYVRYWSGGSSEIAWSIETEESLAALAAKTTAKNFVYYGMMLILIIIASFAFLMTRRPVFLAYAGYAGSALLFVMHADGNGFRFLWPGSPHFNTYASVALGSGIIVFGAVFAMLFLKTRRYHPVIDKLLAGVILITIGMLIASAFLDNQPIKKILVLVAFIAIVLFAVSGLAAARHRFKQVRFYVLAWTGAVASSAIMAGRHWLGIEISQEVQLDSMRIVMVSDAALMGLAIWDYFKQLHQARQSALQANLAKTIHNLELTRRLEDLEEQYAIACELADQKGRQFADAIHDLNQPLHALRLDLKRLARGRGADPRSRARIEETLGYLEKLVAGQLEGAMAQGPPPDRFREVDGTEQLGVGDTLRAIHEMFVSDAREKGLDFRYVDTTLQARIKTLVLMRIVTNLVANAIKYTDQGRILLGCRRKGDKLRIEVHDTGPGMTQEDFVRASARSVRLDCNNPTADGHGLGLSIARSLAEEHGFALKIAPGRTGGTGLRLTVPRNHCTNDD